MSQGDGPVGTTANIRVSAPGSQVGDRITYYRQLFLMVAQAQEVWAVQPSVIAKIEGWFADIHQSMDIQNQVFDRYDLVHVHSRIVGTLKPDEIAVLKFWHFDRMHRMDAVDHHRAHRMCQALGGKQSVQHVSSYPFGSTEYYVVEKLAAEYEKRFSSDGLREAFLEAVNIMQFVTQRAPGTPTATWFSQLLRGGSGGGWATSR